MATPAGSHSQEYWRPSNPDVARVIPAIRGICWQCGMDYSPGARFCHICGGARDARNAVSVLEPEASPDDMAEMVRPLGLSLSCFLCLIVGAVCTLAAVLTGVIYKEDTLVDWQAVQTWRIEWLLGAAVALLAGILLKKKEV